MSSPSFFELAKVNPIINPLSIYPFSLFFLLGPIPPTIEPPHYNEATHIRYSPNCE
jgi:hypothetical protein